MDSDTQLYIDGQWRPGRGAHPPGTLIASVLIAAKSLPAAGSLREGAQIKEPFIRSGK
jgi:hypothetical protein